MRVILTIVSIIALLGNFCSASNDFQYSFSKTIGNSGNENGQFDYPCCIDTDIYGNLYVSDWKNDRIQKFSSSGNFLLSITGDTATKSKMSRPIGITVTSNDRIYVVDYGNHRILVFDLSGKFIASFGKLGDKNGEFAYPRGIAKDNKNNVYVADFQNCRIQKFDFQGTFISSFKCRAANSKKFYSPRSVAVNSKDQIYAVYSQQSIVSKFSSSGKLMLSFGKKGSQNGEFLNPRYIACDAYDNVFITDWNHRVQIFNDKGDYLGMFNNAQKAAFKNPEGICCDKDCNLYIADAENNRIQFFSASPITIHKTRAMYYKKNGYKDKLIAEYEQIIKYDSANTEIAALLKDHYLEIARKYKNSSQFEKAEKYYLKVLILDPTHSEALEFKSQLLNKTTAPEVKKDESPQNITIDVNDPKLMYGLVVVLAVIILIILLTKPKKTKTVRKIRKKVLKNSSKKKISSTKDTDIDLDEGESDDNLH